ncbi:MarR family winged helix-turn-helix transcriptional regulator [Afifella sp. IM 167]|uniref:MarR family winged helix-turn-helix transcriptional regulator n=1 Tax=Afifella sp. IM 167 TaxID=2033586 RepID=UPI001CCA9B5A|nr:MarR family winged helix-turn-helix transcriptional regulator [Afifella sp. IM 167]MBZ8133966.1 MarR family transcriptional regulator [Afifella sp. IM 167]
MQQKTTLGFLIMDAARHLRRHFEQRSRHLGMTSAQLQILGRIAFNEGINQAGLAALLDMEPITVCRHIDRMEAAGFVERRPDASDRRVRLLYITETGRNLLPEMRALAHSIFEEAQAGLGEKERAALLTGLEHLVRNLSERPASETGADREAVKA